MSIPVKKLNEIEEIVSRCNYPGYELRVKTDPEGVYMQIFCPEDTCNMTGEKISWTGRKWRLSQFMCRNELVTTAFKAITGAIEHEVREKFTYRGQTIFDPHLDPELLYELRLRDDALNVREPN